VAAIFPMMSRTSIAMGRSEMWIEVRSEGEIELRAGAEIVAGGRVVVRVVVDAGGRVVAVDMAATVVAAAEDTKSWPRIFTD
jgi:hypothetical protein